MTVRELAKLAQHIIRTYPDAYKIYGEREFTWNKVRQQNRNPLLAMNIGADGMKTGFTKEAGYGLVGSAVNNDLRLIVVVNGFKSMKERARGIAQADGVGLPRLRGARPVRRRARRSAKRSSSAAPKATYRWSARLPIQLAGAARDVGEALRQGGLFTARSRRPCRRASRSAR